MRRRGVHLAAVLGLALSLFSGACARFHSGQDPDEWTVALASAQSRAASGEFTTADGILAAYAARHPGTPETLETTSEASPSGRWVTSV